MKVTFVEAHQSQLTHNELYPAGATAQFDERRAYALKERGIAIYGWPETPEESDPKDSLIAKLQPEVVRLATELLEAKTLVTELHHSIAEFRKRIAELEGGKQKDPPAQAKPAVKAEKSPS